MMRRSLAFHFAQRWCMDPLGCHGGLMHPRTVVSRCLATVLQCGTL